MSISSVSNTYAAQQAYGVQNKYNFSSATTGTAQSGSTSVSSSGDRVSISHAAYQALQEAIKASNNASSTQTNSSQGSTTNNTMTASSNNSTSSTSTSMTMAQIAQQYDVTNMSPTDMINMAGSLLKSGAISSNVWAVMTSEPAVELQSASGSNGPQILSSSDANPSDPNAIQNFLSKWQTASQFDQANGLTMDYSVNNQITSVLSELANLHQTTTS